MAVNNDIYNLQDNLAKKNKKQKQSINTSKKQKTEKKDRTNKQSNNSKTYKRQWK